MPGDLSLTAKLSERKRELAPFVWDAPLELVSAPPARQPVVRQDPAMPRRSTRMPLPTVRDRYVAARFPGLVRRSADLEKTELVIEGARHYFEERKTDRALELLDLAVEQCPFDEPLRLARLEIAFLLRDAALYTALALEFQKVHGARDSWHEVTRLGRAIAPDEAVFGSRQGDRAHEHYGPWPHLPNWIRASWDLTPEILAADYHRIMACTAPRTPEQMLGAATWEPR